MIWLDLGMVHLLHSHTSTFFIADIPSMHCIYLGWSVLWKRTEGKKNKRSLNFFIILQSNCFFVNSSLICILVENWFIYRKSSGDYLSRMRTKSSISTLLRKRRWKVWQPHLHMYIWSIVSFVWLELKLVHQFPVYLFSYLSTSESLISLMT